MIRSGSRAATRCSIISTSFSVKNASSHGTQGVDMERDFSGVLATTLSEMLWSASSPIIVDVRSHDEVHAVDRLITGAIQRSPENVHDWWRDLPAGRSVVICDLFGGEKAWQVTDMLRKCGTDV